MRTGESEDGRSRKGSVTGPLRGAASWAALLGRPVPRLGNPGSSRAERDCMLPFSTYWVKFSFQRKALVPPQHDNDNLSGENHPADSNVTTAYHSGSGANPCAVTTWPRLAGASLPRSMLAALHQGLQAVACCSAAAPWAALRCRHVRRRQGRPPSGK